MSGLTVPTVYMSRVNLLRWLGQPYSTQENTTLNQKLNIQQSADLPTNQYPVPKCLAIGNGGHGMGLKSDGYPAITTLYHTPTDPVLFKQIPFIARRTDNDLSPTERAKYRMRRLETHHGVDYFVYYLRIIDANYGNIEQYMVTTENGVSTPIAYEPPPSLMNPTPVTLSQIEAGTGVSLENKLSVSQVLSEEEAAEILNAVRIIYGSDDYADITEVALYAGVDNPIVSTAGGVSASYTEFLGAQPWFFIDTLSRVRENTPFVQFDFNLGNTYRMPV